MAFFDEMRQQIEAFGGTVEEFAGDAIMAVFGVPRVNEDDAERAVRAAFAMQESMGQLNPMFDQEYGAHLVLRIGIATGEAVAAGRAVNDFMVTGEVPNLAARLQSVGDGITVSEATYQILAPGLHAERLEPLSLKGFGRPIIAYRALELRETEALTCSGSTWARARLKPYPPTRASSSPSSCWLPAHCFRDSQSEVL